MILEQGNMWDVFGKTGIFFITTNPIIRKDGAVVMGRGIASQAKDRFPRLPFDFANRIQQLRDHGPVRVNVIGRYDNQSIGFFMVKDHWAEEAKLSIIKESVEALARELTPRRSQFSTGTYLHNVRFDLNFPGIGNGKLRREDVLPIIEQLPDNVHVWEFKSEE